MLQVGVLVSGSGTNLQALINFSKLPSARYKIKHVISNNPKAKALKRAEKSEISTSIVNHKNYGSRQEFDAVLVKTLKEKGCTIVVLAGFMRLLSPVMVSAFENRILNVHPSLLPAFPGVHAPEQALEAGVKVTGCTVHYVDTGLDTGKIIAQHAVGIFEDDTVKTLTRRIQTMEHQLLPMTLQKLATLQI